MSAYSVALVLLVDRNGALLMQHRDGNARLAPYRWSLPGGHIEPGETPLQAAHRELFEETGLTVDELEPFWVGPRPVEASVRDDITMYAFCGRTDAGQGDVVLGEGQAMVFVDPADALGKDMAVSAALVVPMFLASSRYTRLRTPER